MSAHSLAALGVCGYKFNREILLPTAAARLRRKKRLAVRRGTELAVPSAGSTIASLAVSIEHGAPQLLTAGSSAPDYGQYQPRPGLRSFLALEVLAILGVAALVMALVRS
jgi:hypothetical protein